MQPGPRIGCIVLAGGMSRRMGVNKLTQILDDKAVLLHVVDTALASILRPIVVVTGHQSDLIAPLLANRDVSIVHNQDYAAGQSTTLRTGIAHLPADLAGVAVLLGDMPAIAVDTLDQMARCFSTAEAPYAVVPVFRGQRGNPVILGRGLFDQVMALRGDGGAKPLLRGPSTIEMETDDPAILSDIDTAADLESARLKSQA